MSAFNFINLFSTETHLEGLVQLNHLNTKLEPE